ncbi:MAG: hypothetical protein ACI9JT_002656, partial [Polaribacter sp.]
MRKITLQLFGFFTYFIDISIYYSKSTISGFLNN